MSTLFCPTETPMPVGLRRGLDTLNAAVTLMLFVAVVLVSLYFWINVMHGGGVGPDPDQLPPAWLSPRGNTVFDHVLPDGVAPPAGH